VSKQPRQMLSSVNPQGSINNFQELLLRLPQTGDHIQLLALTLFVAGAALQVGEGGE
jgi:hypothetical protein